LRKIGPEWPLQNPWRWDGRTDALGAFLIVAVARNERLLTVELRGSTPARLGTRYRRVAASPITGDRETKRRRAPKVPTPPRINRSAGVACL